VNVLVVRLAPLRHLHRAGRVKRGQLEDRDGTAIKGVTAVTIGVVERVATLLQKKTKKALVKICLKVII